jgi:hypothetical protein
MSRRDIPAHCLEGLSPPLRQVFSALCKLMAPPEPPKRPVGFVTPEDKEKKEHGSARSKP